MRQAEAFTSLSNTNHVNQTVSRVEGKQSLCTGENNLSLCEINYHLYCLIYVITQTSQRLLLSSNHYGEVSNPISCATAKEDGVRI